MDTKKFCVRNTNNVEYLTVPSLDKISCIKHLFSTRKGGVSEGIYSSMNLSFERGDVKERVLENYKRISQVLDCNLEDFVAAAQTHTTNIRIVTNLDRGKGVIKPADYTDVDGLITNLPGIVLVTYFADCVPLYFVDDVKNVIGLAHSGYRGTLNCMGQKMVMKMEQVYGCRRSDIKAVIGPSICVNCYEVGREINVEFQKKFPFYNDKIFLPGKNHDKFHLNLWEANRRILIESGIKEENLTVTDLCTCCHKNELFSHRGSLGKRGNLAAFLGIKREEV